MQVLKFGGTSVANAENIKRVAGIIGSAVLKDKTVVVVSALGGVTDMLLQCGATAAKAATASQATPSASEAEK